MPVPLFYVIQIAEADPHANEIIQSYPTKDEALRAAEIARQEDQTNYFEYMVSNNIEDLKITDQNPW